MIFYEKIEKHYYYHVNVNIRCWLLSSTQKCMQILVLVFLCADFVKKDFNDWQEIAICEWEIIIIIIKEPKLVKTIYLKFYLKIDLIKLCVVYFMVDFVHTIFEWRLFMIYIYFGSDDKLNMWQFDDLLSTYSWYII